MSSTRERRPTPRSSLPLPGTAGGPHSPASLSASQSPRAQRVPTLAPHLTLGSPPGPYGPRHPPLLCQRLPTVRRAACWVCAAAVSTGQHGPQVLASDRPRPPRADRPAHVSHADQTRPSAPRPSDPHWFAHRRARADLQRARERPSGSRAGAHKGRVSGRCHCETA
ncbi:hypothetical protein CALCODRAFT_165482 [Calocera cornea HHB12733]|uniref:Uncharacterized protein n=1 Tax=Calocera cornea HHB12733 TaxID=1353952 RepID=A0A165CHT7_9BASI|nr:hypothetical protein CALCODRAFT_165482 [Calocera cornea HHB12733]